MVGVDNFGEFASVDHLLKHPHVHCGVKRVVFCCVGAHYLGNSRTPEEMRDLCFNITDKLKWINSTDAGSVMTAAHLLRGITVTHIL